MKQEKRIAAQGRRPSLVRLAIAGSAIVSIAYTLVFVIARQFPLLNAFMASLANTIPVVGFGLLAYRIVESKLVGRPGVTQIFGHLVIAVAYGLLTYWLLVVLLGALASASLLQFQVEPFPVRASGWQLLQNVTTYGIIAALAYAGRREELTVVLSEEAQADPPGLSRYFIRRDDDIRPVDVGTIVSIAGADDYAEVRTTGGTHLVRMTLAEFEKSLDPARFIRVHRSRIVNTERILRAEPAGGGRLLLHMEDGEAIAASRTGSRLLRDRVL